MSALPSADPPVEHSIPPQDLSTYTATSTSPAQTVVDDEPRASIDSIEDSAALDDILFTPRAVSLSVVDAPGTPASIRAASRPGLPPRHRQTSQGGTFCECGRHSNEWLRVGGLLARVGHAVKGLVEKKR